MLKYLLAFSLTSCATFTGITDTAPKYKRGDCVIRNPALLEIWESKAVFNETMVFQVGKIKYLIVVAAPTTGAISNNMAQLGSIDISEVDAKTIKTQCSAYMQEILRSAPALATEQ